MAQSWRLRAAMQLSRYGIPKAALSCALFGATKAQFGVLPGHQTAVSWQPRAPTRRPKCGRLPLVVSYSSLTARMSQFEASLGPRMEVSWPLGVMMGEQKFGMYDQ